LAASKSTSLVGASFDTAAGAAGATEHASSNEASVEPPKSNAARRISARRVNADRGGRFVPGDETSGDMLLAPILALFGAAQDSSPHLNHGQAGCLEGQTLAGIRLR
jgi:hypothetical protein